MSRRLREARPKRHHLSAAAATHVRGLIMSEACRPGEIVRPETVGEELGISATPAREALQALGSRRSEPAAGPRLRGRAADRSGHPGPVQRPGADRRRAGGESRAAGNATDVDVRELDALHHELIAAAARGDETLLEEKNHQFHRQINLMTAASRIAWTRWRS